MDPRQEELLTQFTRFLDFLLHPEASAQMLEDLKVWVKKQQDVLGPLALKEEAEKYLADTKVKAEKEAQDAKDRHEALMAEVAKQRQKLIDAQADVAKVKADVEELKLEVEAEKTLASNLRSNAEEAFTKGQDLLKDLAKREMDVMIREKALEEKATRLQKALAG